MMNDEPIPIVPVTRTEPLIGVEETLALDKARHTRHIQTGFLWFLGIVIIGFLTPLFVWLTRLALGG